MTTFQLDSQGATFIKFSRNWRPREYIFSVDSERNELHWTERNGLMVPVRRAVDLTMVTDIVFGQV